MDKTDWDLKAQNGMSSFKKQKLPKALSGMLMDWWWRESVPFSAIYYECADFWVGDYVTTVLSKSTFKFHGARMEA